MSSTIDNVDCPKCCGSALLEHDNKTQETRIHCTEPDCDYDSDKE
jgi:ribosomal protein S27AE